ncbi:hypothetical protein [Gallaecimonas pentaromativorans]|uniref:YpeB-like protein with protease inhibitory function n=1 Tax=Gallaecimonas pentaromativorans TaxID=584787 RepID=A0A3N1PPQ5_9GAMM|nr:hypothetical protein [Gallaecimonas pentaromativorans]MED5523545.1 hypothetical protein [Pseudomonadota bacterium]ROQ30735.1 hypothetical protein EDC28_101427 [Gallaecimonas pentaromativorans]
MKLYKSLPALFILASASLFAREMQPEDVLDVMASGTIKPFDELHDNLLAAFPGARIKAAELLQVEDDYHYRLHIRDHAEQTHQVLMDAASGIILGACQSA